MKREQATNSVVPTCSECGRQSGESGPLQDCRCVRPDDATFSRYPLPVPSAPLLSHARAKAADRVVSWTPSPKGAPDKLIDNKGKPLPAMPDPGLAGPHVVTADKYYFFFAVTAPSIKCEGQIYSSGVVGPLVLILPLDVFPGTNWLLYQKLGRHLASHGFNVATVSRIAAALPFDIILQETVNYFFSGQKQPQSPLSPFVGLLPDSVAIIGHSHGGSDALQHFKLVRKPTLGFVTPRNLKSLVLMAPSFSSKGEKNDYFTYFLPMVPEFDSSVDSFLGLSVTHDADSFAYGPKKDGQPMLSNFLVYDTFGSSSKSINFCPILKDMIFASPFSHKMQEYTFVLAYTAAFLQKHLIGNSVYDAMFKLQARPPSISGDKIWQQHEEKFHLGVFDGDNQSASLNSIEKSPEGINTSVSTPWMVDKFSPHLTKLLRIFWNRFPGQGANWFRFKLNDLNVVPVRSSPSILLRSGRELSFARPARRS